MQDRSYYGAQDAFVVSNEYPASQQIRSDFLKSTTFTVVVKEAIIYMSRQEEEDGIDPLGSRL